MTKQDDFRLYQGTGETIGDRGIEWPELRDPTTITDPAGYLADTGLRDAVNVALTLQQPLLVTGEPGTGKTQLAASIAHELELPPPLIFHTKTTSTARDLFYRYDALRHFHDAQFQGQESNIDAYIEYDCLGLAILLGMAASEADPFLPQHLKGRGPIRSVVLIDEIDKAPRDLPNDVLNEIEEMRFTVKETGRTFSTTREYRPIVVLTSNSEKNLPDAFLRRCAYYHIPFPNADRLKEIVSRRLSFDGHFSPDRVDHAIKHFEDLRELSLRKPPATAELLAWLQILERLDVDVENPKPEEADLLALTYSVLAKSKEDLALMRERSA